MTYKLPDGLTPLEQRVLTYYLEHESDTDVRDSIAAQLSHASIGDLNRTGVGFFRPFSVPLSAPVSRTLGDAVFDTAFATHPELAGGAMFMLFVKEGVVSCLEGVTMSGDWPADEDTFSFR